MPKPSNPNPRTFGIKLLEPKSDKKVEFPVTTRRFDIERYKLTGEIEYIDEEGLTMPNPNAVENAKHMREEITTLAQFNEFKNYTEVAKKYHVSPSTAHGHLMRLKAANEAEKKVIQADNPTLNEIEQFHTDIAPSECPRVELDESINLEAKPRELACPEGPEDDIEWFENTSMPIIPSIGITKAGLTLNNAAVQKMHLEIGETLRIGLSKDGKFLVGKGTQGLVLRGRTPNGAVVRSKDLVKWVKQKEIVFKRYPIQLDTQIHMYYAKVIE